MNKLLLSSRTPRDLHMNDMLKYFDLIERFLGFGSCDGGIFEKLLRCCVSFFVDNFIVFLSANP